MDFHEINRRNRERAVKALTAAAMMAANEIKDTLSVPAPRKTIKGRGGSRYYRAATPATPGEPPRKLSGRLRASISWGVDKINLRSWVGTNVVYGPVHEHGAHPFVQASIARIRGNLRTLLGRV